MHLERRLYFGGKQAETEKRKSNYKTADKMGIHESTDKRDNEITR